MRRTRRPNPQSTRVGPPRQLALVLLAAGGLAIGGSPASVAAQAGAVAGVVLSTAGLTPVADAQVTVSGSTLGAATDVNGRFRIQNVPGTEATLRVVRLGYRPITQVVRVGDTELRFLLTDAPIELNEIVVTGTPGAAQRRSLGNSVTTIDAPENLQISGAGDLGNLINARAPGVVVTPGTGRSGAGPSIAIRGRGTLSVTNQQPIVYIDGVRIANDIGTGPQIQGGTIASRLNDISPEDIESIEVLRGPSAATLYGTEASNGVMQIITKKGRAAAQPQWGVTIRQGATWFQDPQGRIPTNFFRHPVTGEISSFNGVTQEDSLGNPIWSTGHLQSFGVNVSGGTEKTRYYVSSIYDRDEGIEPNNGIDRFSAHANLGLTGEKFDLSTSLNVVKGETELGNDNGFSVMFATLYGLPQLAGTAFRGFNLAPPDAIYALTLNTQDIARFTGGVSASHRPFSWLSHRLSVGLDQTSEDNRALQRFAPPEFAPLFSPTAARGSIVQSIRNIAHTTADYSASATAGLSDALISTSSVGAQYHRQRLDVTAITGSEFPAPGVETAAAAARISFGSQDFLTNTTLGLYVQQQFAWKDRLFLTGAVRVDNNSAFGDDIDLVTYPKVSGAWVVSEEPFWGGGLGFIGTLRLRAAYGAAGQPPDVFSALRTFQAVTATLDQPGVTPQFAGNPDLKPERGEEFELGFDAGLFSDRIGIDFTYFNRRTRDAILLRPLPPSGGFPGNEPVNIGEISNQGIEAIVNVHALDQQNFGWDLSFNIGTADDEVKELGDLPFIALATALPLQRHVEGFPTGAFFVKRIVSADYNPTTRRAINLMCDGGPENNGQALPCAQAPRVFRGTPTPKVNGAVSSTFTLWKRLRLYGLVDFKTGHRTLDADGLIRCALFSACEINVRPEDFDPIDVAYAQNAGGFEIIDGFIRDASFAKLREISASYTLPEGWARRVGATRATITVAGRNLHTWTDYPGLDPESRAVITQVINFDQAITPQLAQFITTVNLTF